MILKRGDILLVFFMLFLFPESQILSQQHFKTYTINDGLSSNSVLTIEMDSVGYLWVGTYYGLNRFDGQEFKQYFLDEPVISSDNQISKIFTDSKGRLWVGTFSNLYLYNEDADQFIRINDQTINVGAIAESPDHSIWVVGYGVFIVEESDLSLTEVNVIGGNERKIEDIVFDCMGRIWLGWFNDGITMCKYIKLRDRKELFVEIPFTKESSPNMNSNIVRDLFLDDNDLLWFTTYEGLKTIDISKDERYLSVEPVPALSSKSRFWSIIKDRKGRFWAGSYGDGLYIIDGKYEWEETVTNIKTNLQDIRSISCNAIHAIFEDRYGKIWIASENGLNLVIQNEIEYKTYYNSSYNQQSISSNHVYEIYQDSLGKIWLGTSDGLFMMDYKRSDGIFERCFLSNSGYAENYILSILPADEKSHFFIGCRDGLYRYELSGKSEKIQAVRHRYDKSIHTVRNITEIGTKLWLSTDNALHIYDYKSNELSGYMDFGYQDLDCRNILFTHDSTALIATNYGLFEVLNPLANGNSYRTHQIALDSTNSHPNQHFVSCLLQDNQQIIWIGTHNGLYRYDPDSLEYLKINLLDGIREKFIAGMVDYGNEIITVGLSTISLVNKQDLSIESFAFSTAITNERESFYLEILNDGNLALGGINGLKILNPASLNKNTVHYPLIIQDLIIGNKSVKPAVDRKLKEKRNISTTDKIYLDNKSNSFRLNFSSLYFADNMDYIYSYKLEGYDKEWMFVNHNQGYANYSKLNPGNYTFRVNATNAVGQWNNTDTLLEITVLPPFYLKWYAIIFYLCILTVIFIIVRNEISIRYKLASEKIAKGEIEKKNREQMQFFINVSHELKTPLALISGPLEHIHSHLEKDDKLFVHAEWARNNALKLTTTINEILDLRLLDANKLKPSLKETEWKNFIETIYGYFSPLAQQRKIEYTLSNSIEELVIIDHSMIEKSIINLLDNAFKYTPNNAKITLSSYIEKENHSSTNDYIHFICHNTGSNIDADDLERVFERFFYVGKSVDGGSGIGLSVTKQFIELHNGRIWCEADESEGVAFHFIIPIEESSEETRITEAVKESVYSKIYTSSLFVEESKETTAISNRLRLSDQSDTKLKYEIYGSLEANSIDSDASQIRDNGKKKILIVEDDVSLRNFIASILEDSFHILLAGNGKEALDIVNTTTHPNLIISDIMMPMMDGFALCGEIKGDDLTSHIPIILLTARPEQYSLLESFKYEANAYIEKPFTKELLIFCIRSILNQYETLKKYYGAKILDFYGKKDEMDPNQKFVDELRSVIVDNIDNSLLSIETLCSKMSISQYMLYNKIKAITGRTPGQIIRTIRVHKAENLLKMDHHSIKEIQYLTGFSSAKAFRDAFKEEFGVLPSEYSKQGKIS